MRSCSAVPCTLSLNVATEIRSCSLVLQLYIILQRESCHTVALTSFHLYCRAELLVDGVDMRRAPSILAEPVDKCQYPFASSHIEAW